MRGLTRNQVISRVYRTRERHYESIIHGQIEVPPMPVTRRGDAPLFQFHFSYSEGGENQRMIALGHLALVQLLTYNQTSLFIDGAFYCVPYLSDGGGHDRGSQCHVAPCISVYEQDREGLLTYVSLCHCSDLHEHRPATVACDFEQIIISAFGDQFPDATLVTCLFQFKQAQDDQSSHPY